MADQKMTEGVSFQAYRNGDKTMVRLIGHLRMLNSETVRGWIQEQMQQEGQQLYLDMSQMSDVDSAGLGVLVGLHMTARSRKVGFYLIAPLANHLRLFEVTRLNMVLSIVTGAEAEQIRTQLIRPEFRAEV